MEQISTAILCASTVTGDTVRNMKGEDLGRIEEVMIDLDCGRVAYAILASDGFFGRGETLRAVPWTALNVDLEQREFVLDMDRERLERAPSIDEDNWPSMSDRQWGETIHGFYGSTPYWRGDATARLPS